ncbi:MAG: cache domain-containing protein [Candidatus Hodarchaeota archaeon]
MLKKKSIKKKITSLFIAMSSITLIFVSGISIGFVTLISKSTTDSTSTSLRNQIENNMLMTAEESSRVIMKKLQRVIAYLEGIISSIKQLFGAEVQFNATTSYFDYNLSTLPPDAIFNPIYNDYISNSTSTYYIPNSNPSNIDSLRTISMNASINKSAHVDSLLSSIFNENQGIAWIRIAFEDGHILRRFPGTTVDPFRTYDPLTSVWYLQAKASLQEAVIYSNPFQDTTNFGWLLSISKSIYVNDTFIGVASIDLKLQTIQNDILTMTFLDTGYSALIQPDGTILAHPEWDFNGSIRNINDLEIHSNQTPAINLAMIQNTGFLTSGLLEFMKDDDKYILSYAPVNEQYYFISIVKELEAIKSVELIRQDSMHIQSIVLFGTIMLSLLVFVIVLTCGVMTATKITEPID